MSLSSSQLANHILPLFLRSPYVIDWIEVLLGVSPAWNVVLVFFNLHFQLGFRGQLGLGGGDHKGNFGVRLPCCQQMVAWFLVGVIIMVFIERLILMDNSLVRIVLRAKIIWFSHGSEAHINETHSEALHFTNVETSIWLFAYLNLLIDQDIFRTRHLYLSLFGDNKLSLRCLLRMWALAKWDSLFKLDLVGVRSEITCHFIFRGC